MCTFESKWNDDKSWKSKPSIVEWEPPAPPTPTPTPTATPTMTPTPTPTPTPSPTPLPTPTGPPDSDHGDPAHNKGPRGPQGVEDACGNGSGKGSPVWSVNMVNLNLYVKDIPLWYNPPIGPSMSLMLSYNSQAAITSGAPFGNKWVFSYGSTLVEDGGGEVTIVMPDGRQDTFIPLPGGAGVGYTPPYRVWNILTKVATN